MSARPQISARPDAVVVAGVRISHPERVIWPELGIEKIEAVHTVTPEDDHAYAASDFGESKHAVIFDAFTDAPAADGPELEDMI